VCAVVGFHTLLKSNVGFRIAQAYRLHSRELFFIQNDVERRGDLLGNVGLYGKVVI